MLLIFGIFRQVLGFMKKIILLFLLIFIVSCSSIKVIEDYDITTDFSQYKTYQFFKDAGDGFNDFDVKRVENIIAKEVELLGISSSKNPDFFIDYSSTIQYPPNYKSVGVGISGGQPGISISTNVLFGKEKPKETILVEFLDTKTKSVFWKASLIHKLKPKITPEKREVQLQESLKKMMTSYLDN